MERETMEREVNFKLPIFCNDERILSVSLVGQYNGYMRVLIKSCDADYRIAARKWLEKHIPQDGCYTTIVRRNVTVVKNRRGEIGIAIYKEGDSIPYSLDLGESLALADSYGLKQKMMKDIGMV